MRKIWIAVLAGAMVLTAAGCKGREADESDAAAETWMSVKTVTADSKARQSAEKNEAWIDLGFDGEINANARTDLAESWWEVQGDVYIPLDYAGEGEGTKPYCYLNWATYTDIIEIEPPEDIYGLPDFFYEKTMGWFSLFAMSETLGSNHNGIIEMGVDEQKAVTINGGEFLRVTGTVRNIDEAEPKHNKEQKYIIYYGLLVPQKETFIYKDNTKIPAKNCQTFFIMGDTSENQDRFDDVCELADSIMSTYRIKER